MLSVCSQALYTSRSTTNSQMLLKKSIIKLQTNRQFKVNKIVKGSGPTRQVQNQFNMHCQGPERNTFNALRMVCTANSPSCWPGTSAFIATCAANIRSHRRHCQCRIICRERSHNFMFSFNQYLEKPWTSSNLSGHVLMILYC